MLTKEENRNNIREFRKLFLEELTKMREERDLSMEDLAKQSHIPLAELLRLEQKREYVWGTLFQLSRFFEKKIRIMFY